MSAEVIYTPDEDPADFTVDQVSAFLATADAETFSRVQAREAEGKNRTGITGVTKPRVALDGGDGYTRVPVEAYRPGTPLE
jgi:hypothetical protein